MYYVNCKRVHTNYTNSSPDGSALQSHGSRRRPDGSRRCPDGSRRLRAAFSRTGDRLIAQIRCSRTTQVIKGNMPRPLSCQLSEYVNYKTRKHYANQPGSSVSISSSSALTLMSAVINSIHSAKAKMNTIFAILRAHATQLQTQTERRTRLHS